MQKFNNRKDAGIRLAKLLSALALQDACIYALPRGGVPVGHAIAKYLNIPLDILLVRKLGVPFQPELAMGAIASGGIEILDSSLINSLHISSTQVQEVLAREKIELIKREQRYQLRNRHSLHAKHVILVDDGIATGSTMLAAITAARSEHPQTVTVAVPVAPADIKSVLVAKTENFVCLAFPSPFRSVGSHYVDFSQTSDLEVSELLQDHNYNFHDI